jgi:translation initiation factor IF-2
MSKKRIYEYAKELNLKSKDIIDELKKMNVEVSNHMQALEDNQIVALDKIYKKDNNQKDNGQAQQSKEQGQKQACPRQQKRC